MFFKRFFLFKEFNLFSLFFKVLKDGVNFFDFVLIIEIIKRDGYLNLTRGFSFLDNSALKG